MNRAVWIAGVLCVVGAFNSSAARAPFARAGFIQLRLAEAVPGDRSRTLALRGSDERVTLAKQMVLDQSQVDSAAVAADAQQEGAWRVELCLTPWASKALARVTRENVGRRLGVIVGGELMVAPVVREPVALARLQIAAGLPRAEADSIAARVNEGLHGASLEPHRH